MKDLKIGGNDFAAIKHWQNCPWLFADTKLEATLWRPSYQTEQLRPIISYWRGLLSCQDSGRKAIQKNHDKLLPMGKKKKKATLLKSKHLLEIYQVQKYFHKEDLWDPKRNFQKLERETNKQTNRVTEANFKTGCLGHRPGAQRPRLNLQTPEESLKLQILHLKQLRAMLNGISLAPDWSKNVNMFCILYSLPSWDKESVCSYCFS